MTSTSLPPQSYKSIVIVFFLATITILMIAVAIEVFYFRRNRVIGDISTMVGEHMRDLRSTEAVGGPMPMGLLSEAMNQSIDENNEVEANKSILLMLDLAKESRRRSFSLPIVHRDIALKVKKLADRSVGEVAVNAAKLFTIIAKRHTEHMDGVLAQAHVIISKTDARTATQSMKSLAYQINGAITIGVSIDPKLLISKENNEVIQQWLSSTDEHAKASAELLLKAVQDAESVT
jgi:hypothetical protein